MRFAFVGSQARDRCQTTLLSIESPRKRTRRNAPRETLLPGINPFLRNSQFGVHYTQWCLRALFRRATTIARNNKRQRALFRGRKRDKETVCVSHNTNYAQLAGTSFPRLFGNPPGVRIFAEYPAKLLCVQKLYAIMAVSSFIIRVSDNAGAFKNSIIRGFARVTLAKIGLILQLRRRRRRFACFSCQRTRKFANEV